MYITVDKGQCINHQGNPILYEIKHYADENGKMFNVALCPICVRKYNSDERVNLHSFMPLHRPKEHDGVIVYGIDN